MKKTTIMAGCILLLSGCSTPELPIGSCLDGVAVDGVCFAQCGPQGVVCLDSEECVQGACRPIETTKITRFEASPTTVRQGDEITLRFSAVNADTLELTGVGLLEERFGSVTVIADPAVTSYELVARGATTDTDTEDVVFVDEPPPEGFQVIASAKANSSDPCTGFEVSYEVLDAPAGERVSVQIYSAGVPGEVQQQTSGTFYVDANNGGDLPVFQLVATAGDQTAISEEVTAQLWGACLLIITPSGEDGGIQHTFDSIGMWALGAGDSYSIDVSGFEITAGATEADGSVFFSLVLVPFFSGDYEFNFAVTKGAETHVNTVTIPGDRPELPPITRRFEIDEPIFDPGDRITASWGIEYGPTSIRLEGGPFGDQDVSGLTQTSQNAGFVSGPVQLSADSGWGEDVSTVLTWLAAEEMEPNADASPNSLGTSESPIAMSGRLFAKQGDDTDNYAFESAPGDVRVIVEGLTPGGCAAISVVRVILPTGTIVSRNGPDCPVIPISINTADGDIRIQVVGNSGATLSSYYRVRAAHVPRECGDGLLHSSEECDDGNTEVGDGCNPNCLLEPTHIYDFVTLTQGLAPGIGQGQSLSSIRAPFIDFGSGAVDADEGSFFLPFHEPFRFFGRTYGGFVASADGVVSLWPDLVLNPNLPTSEFFGPPRPNAVIAAVWRDLITPSFGYEYRGDPLTGGMLTVIEWTGARDQLSGTTFSMQVIFRHLTGEIDVRIQNGGVANLGLFESGIEDASGEYFFRPSDCAPACVGSMTSWRASPLSPGN